MGGHRVLGPLNIAGLEEDNSPDTVNDYLLFYDVSLGAHKKTLASNVGGGGGGDAFTIIQTDNGTSPTADSSTDTLTLESSDSSITITGDSTTDTVDFVLPSTVLVTKIQSRDLSTSYFEFLSSGTLLRCYMSNANVFDLATGGMTFKKNWTMSNNTKFAVGAGGSASSVGMNFGGDTNTGFWATGFGDQFYLTAGGTDVAEILPEKFDAKVPVSLPQYATGSLPTASSFEGAIVYDSTTNQVKFSDGSTWTAM